MRGARGFARAPAPVSHAGYRPPGELMLLTIFNHSLSEQQRVFMEFFGEISLC